MSPVLDDLRHACRRLARTPGFTVVALLTLAVALAAATVVFSVVHGVLLRALPYPGFDRLVDVAVQVPPREGRPGRQRSLDAGSLEAWRGAARRLSGLAAYQDAEVTLTGEGEPARLAALRATPNLLEVLGVAPVRGAGFADRAGPRVVVSHGLWQRRLGGDPGAVGRRLTLDGEPHTVVGVMPEGFFFPRRGVDLWLPRDLTAGTVETAERVSVEYLHAVARLAGGASVAAAQEEGGRILRGRGEGGALAEDLPPGARLDLRPLRERMVAGARPALLAALAAVGLVVLIACVNLAHLFLARGAARRRELAVRSALGASRGRLMSQVLAEGLVLALAGAAVALLLAALVHGALPRLLPADLPRVEDVRLDARVFLFAFGLSGVTALLFGLWPAVRAAGTSVVEALRDGGGGWAAGGRSRHPRRLLVVAEVALAAVVLVAAGLLLESFLRLTAVDPGYRPGNVLVATLELPDRYAAPGRGAELFDRLLSRLQAHPRVEAAGAVAFPPLADSFAMVSVGVADQPSALRLAVPQLTSAGYRQAMGLELRAGRWFTRGDQNGGAPVAVVNRTFAREHLADGEPVGRRIELGGTRLRVVGVVGDVQLQGPRGEPRAEVYVPYRSAPALSGGGPRRLTLAARTRGDPLAVAPHLRRLVRQLDPDLPLQDVGSMGRRLAGATAQPRFFALLLGGFAAVALLLACAGLYGVLSRAVVRRTRALGIRRALGARPRQVFLLVMGEGMVLALTGVAAGLAAAWAVSRALSSQLYRIAPRDPATYATAALALLAVAALACSLPARRAARIDPAQALRHE